MILSSCCIVLQINFPLIYYFIFYITANIPPTLLLIHKYKRKYTSSLLILSFPIPLNFLQVTSIPKLLSPNKKKPADSRKISSLGHENTTKRSHNFIFDISIDILTVGNETGPDTENAGYDHRAASEPSPSPAVEHEGEEGVSWQLSSRGDRERHEDVQPQVVDVSHVAVEYQRYGHPGKKVLQLFILYFILIRHFVLSIFYF